MTELRLSRQGGAWVLDGTGARLTTGFSMRRGTVALAGRAWTIETGNPWRSRVALSDGDGFVVRLDPDGSWVPGESGPVSASWETGRGYRGHRGYRGRLDGPHGVLEIRLPRRGPALELSVTGTWSHVELVVLSAAFALLTQRRRDLFRAVTIASVSHH